MPSPPPPGCFIIICLLITSSRSQPMAIQQIPRSSIFRAKDQPPRQGKPASQVPYLRPLAPQSFISLQQPLCIPPTFFASFLDALLIVINKSFLWSSPQFQLFPVCDSSLIIPPATRRTPSTPTHTSGPTPPRLYYVQFTRHMLATLDSNVSVFLMVFDA